MQRRRSLPLPLPVLLPPSSFFLILLSLLDSSSLHNHMVFIPPALNYFSHPEAPNAHVLRFYVHACKQQTHKPLKELYTLIITVARSSLDGTREMVEVLSFLSQCLNYSSAALAQLQRCV